MFCYLSLTIKCAPPFRLLLRMLRPQQSSFVLQRSECALCRSDEALERLNPTEETLQTLTAVRARDNEIKTYVFQKIYMNTA
jgi:hypothetical protein